MLFNKQTCSSLLCSSVSTSRLISARCLGKLEVVSGCDVGDVVLASKMELSPSRLSTFSFNFTSTPVTDCTNCSQPSGVLLGKMISWLVVLITSILFLLDFPGFSDKSISCIRPESQGANSSGSSRTGVLLSIGPLFTRHKFATLVPFGTTASFLSDLTEQSSVSLYLLLMKLTRDSSWSSAILGKDSCSNSGHATSESSLTASSITL